MYAVKMPSCGKIVLPSFVEICAAVQAILRFCLRNFKGCSVGTIEVREL
jgi:hypothetical protein